MNSAPVPSIAPEPELCRALASLGHGLVDVDRNSFVLVARLDGVTRARVFPSGNARRVLAIADAYLEAREMRDRLGKPEADSILCVYYLETDDGGCMTQPWVISRSTWAAILEVNVGDAGSPIAGEA